jgi:hypothetical protein
VVTPTSTQGGAVSPGIPFKLGVFAEDAWGNVANGLTNSFNGTLLANFIFANDASAPPVSGGCGSVYRTTIFDNFLMPDFVSTTCGQTISYSLSFSGGVADSSANGIYALLNDATGVTPSITVTLPGSGLTGSTGAITMAVGPAQRLMLHKALGDPVQNNPNFVCNYQTQYNWSIAGNNCLNVNEGFSSTFYAAYEDAGGNFISNPTITWQPTGAWAGSFTPTTNAQSSTFTANTAGTATLALTDNTAITTNFAGNTKFGSLDHFAIQVTDGLGDPTNTISDLAT